MRFVVAGAGAVGGYLGARLASAGGDVTLLARGPHLAAMREQGVRVTSPDGDFEARPAVASDPEAIGPADVVVLGVKAHSLPDLVPHLGPLLHADTVVMSTQNGIPWWLTPLERVDPRGVISGAIEAHRVVGSIIYFSTEVAEPGVIRHIEGSRMSLGEPGGGRSERCQAIAAALREAGLRCSVTAHLQEEVFVKLMGNAAFNPISALTGATLAEMARHPDVSALAREIMAEVEAVAAGLGLRLPVSIERRMAGAEGVGEHKTSMLQDLEAGRPLELEAIVGAVVELGERLGIETPHIRAVYACAKLRADRR
ncbi:MAG: ketopantoate reductase family protein [Candidatus Dormibacteria bacterium]